MSLFELDDFEETRIEWAPVWEPPSPLDGLTEREMMAAHKADNGAAWKAWQATLRCRDCGELMSKRPHRMGCSGGRAGYGFTLCDDCAMIDGLRLHEHHAHRCDPRPAMLSNWTAAAVCDDCTWDTWTERFVEGSFELEPVPDDVIDAEIAAHNRPYWGGRWGGGRMTREEADRLLAEQSRRRARYLAEEAA